MLPCVRAHVFGVFMFIIVHMFCMFACFMCWRAHMSYMIAVLKYPMCLRSCVLLWHCLSYFLYIWKVKFQNFLYRKICLFKEVLRTQKLRKKLAAKRLFFHYWYETIFCWFDYIALYLFTANLLILILLTSSNGWKPLTIFAKRSIGCLTRFWIRQNL